MLLHGSSQLRFCMGHVYMLDRIGELIEIVLDMLELTIGFGKCPLEYPQLVDLKYVPETWMTSLCKFLAAIKGKIILNRKRVVTKQRTNDKFLMELANKAEFDTNKIQQVRMWLQVTTLADISSEDGLSIPNEWYTMKLRRSRLKWPVQPVPTQNALNE